MNSLYNKEKITSIFNKLQPCLKDLEELRKTLRNKIAIFSLVTVLTVSVLVSSFFLLPQLYIGRTWLYIVLILLIIVLAVVYYYFYVEVLLTDLKTKFYKNVASRIVHEFLKNAEYKQTDTISINDYYASGLFNTRVDRYNGESYIKGTIGQTTLEFSNLHTEYKTTVQTKNGTRTQWHTIFKGAFVVIDPNKNFESETYILPDNIEQTFGRLGKWMQRNTNKSKGELVYLEDPEFEKTFMVYATDPVEARYLITPAMQHRLLELTKHFSRNVYLSFRTGTLYCAIGGATKILTLDTSLNLNSETTFLYYTSKFIDILKIVEILDLNTRIWSK